MDHALSIKDHLLTSPYFEEVEEAYLHQIISSGRVLEFGQEEPIFHHSDSCESFFIVVQGSVRVRKYSECGNVITLYHIKNGQSCELTNACLLGGDRYPAEAIAEVDCTLFFISKKQFLEILTRSKKFRELVFASLDEGMSELLGLIDQLAFGHMDRRLASLLVNTSAYTSTIKATHQELADELGTAREVVSRQLKEFERNNWIVLHRGRLIVTDRAALINLHNRSICVT